MLTQNSWSSVEPSSSHREHYTYGYDEFEPLHLGNIKDEDTKNVYALTEELLRNMKTYRAELAKIETSKPDRYNCLNHIYDTYLQPILELRDMTRNIHLVSHDNRLEFLNS